MNNREFSESFKRRMYQWLLSLLKVLDTVDSNDYLAEIIKKQLIRSSTSIVANYVEAIAGCSARDFVNFVNHSLKSANETKFWLALLRDTNRINQTVAKPLLDENIEIAKMLGSIVVKLKNNKNKQVNKR